MASIHARYAGLLDEMVPILLADTCHLGQDLQYVFLLFTHLDHNEDLCLHKQMRSPCDMSEYK